MSKALGVALAGLIIGFSASAMAAQPSSRIRGTVESIHGNKLAIKSYTGTMIDLMLESGTKYAWVTPANLSEIKSGDYIGTAATGPKNNLQAQEVVIFPNSMRGMGEGHYSWSMPATVARADASGTGGSSRGTMTNGTMTNGTMTNGTANVSSRELTVSYNGQKVHVMVPPNAPVVRFVPAEQSILSPGEKVFIMASKSSGALDASFVAVGKNGLMPPM